MKVSRAAITKAVDLDALDTDEVIEGYRDGRANDPEPGGNRSDSYWHGWRNGQVDGGHAKPDSKQMALAKDAINSGYLRRLNLPT